MLLVYFGTQIITRFVEKVNKNTTKCVDTIRGELYNDHSQGGEKSE